MTTLLLVKGFLMANYPAILFALFALLGFILMGRKQAEAIIIKEMLQAEKYLAENGEAKHDFVVEVAYNALPVYLKPFVTKAMIDTVVEGVLAYIKEDYEKRQSEQQ